MVPCPLCSAPLVFPVGVTAAVIRCSGCRRDVTGVTWPALGRGVGERERVRVPAAVDGGAMCFSCDDRAATGVCAGCGSYTCPACEVEWFGESVCLRCLHARREVVEAPRFRRRALIHDNIALMLLVLPLLVIPFYGIFLAMLASPVVLFLVVRHRRAPRGVPPRGPFRWWLAGGLAVVLLLLGVAGVGLVGYSVMAISQRATEVMVEVPDDGAGAVDADADVERVNRDASDGEGGR
jgi:hypothetical protein